LSKKRPRHADGSVHLVPGERAVRELLDVAPQRIERLLLEDRDRLQGLRDAAEAVGVVVELVGPAELRKRAPNVDARGVLALSTPRVPADLEDLLPADLESGPRRLWLALDGVVDPGNLGAILRSAEFFGVEGVFWAKDRAASLTPAAVRASAGASERLPFSVVTNLVRALQRFQAAGAWVVGTVAEGGRSLRELTDADALPSALVVVMGAEHDGLRRLTRERCDFLTTIAGRGGVASLNVAAATAVVLSALADPAPIPSPPAD
jgi:23S rRNA (guanosine2251-2'-O)-methyltransferase